VSRSRNPSKRPANSSITIGNMTVEPGQRTSIDLDMGRLYTHMPTTMPVQVICGRKAGPILFVSAAIHGDELNGVEILRRLLRLPVLKRLRGTLIAVPIVNLHGFIQSSRYLPDRRDLNRVFPGSERGSLASRVAHLFMNEIVYRCTHGIDLHTGAVHRANLPQIRANLDDPETERLARAFGTPVILNAAIRDGSLREAASERDIPVLLYEAGEALRFDEFSIRGGVNGILRVMETLDMLPASRRKPPAEPHIARSSSWVRAPQSGLFRARVALGNASSAIRASSAWSPTPSANANRTLSHRSAAWSSVARICRSSTRGMRSATLHGSTEPTSPPSASRTTRRPSMPPITPSETIRMNADRLTRLLQCLDLTRLVADDANSTIHALCASARTHHGTPAAVCVLPEFVSTAVDALNETGVRRPVRVATVANFPDGAQPVDRICDSIDRSLSAGADEIDLVLPWRDVVSGRRENAEKVLGAARRCTGSATLKVILETGALPSSLLETSARMVLDNGADFLKTSTGVEHPGADPESAARLLDCIAMHGGDCGLKVSGGIRSTADAERYLSLAERRFGPDWPCKEHFRIGASGLFSALVTELDALDPPSA
jgi:deoxyribose-phosphate aldolase